jgi:hypothetical protein
MTMQDWARFVAKPSFWAPKDLLAKPRSPAQARESGENGTRGRKLSGRRAIPSPERSLKPSGVA